MKARKAWRLMAARAIGSCHQQGCIGTMVTFRVGRLLVALTGYLVNNRKFRP